MTRYALLLLPCAALADPTLYVQGGMGYQIGMEEKAIIRGQEYRAEIYTALPDWVADVQIGMEYRNFYLQGQHVSSVETGQDHGFNVISAGYRWEFEF